MIEKIFNYVNSYYSEDNEKYIIKNIKDPFQSNKFNLNRSFTKKQKFSILKIYYQFIQNLSSNNSLKISNNKSTKLIFDTIFKTMTVNKNSNFDYLGNIDIFLDHEDSDKKSNNIYCANYAFDYDYNSEINETTIFFINKNKLKDEDLKKTIYRNFTEDDDELEEIINKQNDNNNKLKKYIKQIINFSKKRFFVFSINKIWPDKSRHQNLILIDKKNKTIEYYEPHGTSVKIYNSNKIFKSLFDDLKYKFISSDEYQKKFDIQYKFSDIDEGYCVLYCVWYGFLRINNPDIDRKKIIEYMINSYVEVDCIHIFNKIQNIIKKHNIDFFIKLNDDNDEIYNLKNHNFIKLFSSKIDDKTLIIGKINNFLNKIKKYISDYKEIEKRIKDSNKEELENGNLDWQKNIEPFLKEFTEEIYNINLSNDPKCNTLFIKDFEHKLLNLMYTFTEFIYNFFKFMHEKNLKWVNLNIDKLYKKIKNISKTKYKKIISERINHMENVDSYFNFYLKEELKKFGSENMIWFDKVKDGNLFSKGYLERFKNYLKSFIYTDYFEIDPNIHNAFFLINDLGFNNIFKNKYIPYFTFINLYLKENSLSLETSDNIKKFIDINSYDNLNDDISINGYFMMTNFLILLNKLNDNEKYNLVEFLHVKALNYFKENELYDYKIRYSDDLYFSIDTNFKKKKIFSGKPIENLIPKNEYKKRFKENPIKFITQRKKEIVLSIK
jgi:hypothetical protein